MAVLIPIVLLMAASIPAPLPAVVDTPRLVVAKSKRQLFLYSNRTLLRTYRIGLGLNPDHSKSRAGDYATPEGRFYVCVKNVHSKFFLSLGLSYPGPTDAERGLRSGLISAGQYQAILETYKQRRTPPWGTALGGEIFLHGRGSSTDWTWGCIALDDTDIRELFSVIPLGTTVEILH